MKAYNLLFELESAKLHSSPEETALTFSCKFKSLAEQLIQRCQMEAKIAQQIGQSSSQSSLEAEIRNINVQTTGANSIMEPLKTKKIRINRRKALHT